MEALVWIGIGLVAGWHIRSEVQFWHELDMKKIRRDAIKDEPSTEKVADNIVWCGETIVGPEPSVTHIKIDNIDGYGGFELIPCKPAA